MYITDYFIARKTLDSLYTLTDYRRAQMSYVKRFCRIGSAVIHDDRLWLFRIFITKLLCLCHFIDIVCNCLSA